MCKNPHPPLFFRPNFPQNCQNLSTVLFQSFTVFVFLSFFQKIKSSFRQKLNWSQISLTLCLFFLHPSPKLSVKSFFPQKWPFLQGLVSAKTSLLPICLATLIIIVIQAACLEIKLQLLIYLEEITITIPRLVSEIIITKIKILVLVLVTITMG